MKKIVAIILMMCLLLSVGATFIGCAPGEEEQPDPTRTQLYVGLRESGLGKSWLQKAKQEYEKIHPEIQVMIDYLASELDGGTLARTMPDIRQTVIFTNSLTVTALAPSNSVNATYHVVDITDVVTDGGDQSIGSRMNQASYDFYNYGTADAPKFYMIPYFNSIYGMVYDKDMFESYKFFNLECTDEAGKPYTGQKYAGLDTVLGTEDDNWGPDGKQNTIDDGLPATWEDFKILLNVMVDCGVTPFTYSAKEKGYQNRFLSSIWASYEGAANYSIMATLEGTHSKLGEINMSNAWKLAKMDGKYAALTVADYLINGRVDDNGNSVFVESGVRHTSHSAMTAQSNFLNSWPNPQMKDIAFILEGNWWEVEASEIFEECAEIYSTIGDGTWGYGERNFGYFPFPKFKGTPGIPDQENEMTTLGSNISTNNAAAFINAYHTEEQIALGKDFLKFCFSNDMNAEFTRRTGVTRPFDYTMNEDQLADLTTYARSVYDFNQSQYVDKATSCSRIDVYYYEEEFLTESFTFGTIVDTQYGTKDLYPMHTFLVGVGDDRRKVSLEEYWAGIDSYVNETIWATKMAPYI